MFKLVLGKAEEPEIKLPTSTGSYKKQESSRKNIYFCFIDDPTDVGNLIRSSAFSKSEHLEVHSSRIAEAWLGEF